MDSPWPECVPAERQGHTAQETFLNAYLLFLSVLSCVPQKQTLQQGLCESDEFLGIFPGVGEGDWEEKEAKQGCNVKQEATGGSGSVCSKLRAWKCLYPTPRAAG